MGLDQSCSLVMARSVVSHASLTNDFDPVRLYKRNDSHKSFVDLLANAILLSSGFHCLRAVAVAVEYGATDIRTITTRGFRLELFLSERRRSFVVRSIVEDTEKRMKRIEFTQQERKTEVRFE